MPLQPRVFPPRRRRPRASVLSVVLALAVFPGSAAAANWPAWRGPNGDGTTTATGNLPATWGPAQNIKWQRELPAWSGSSPVVWGDRIFVHSPSAEAEEPSVFDQVRRRVSRAPSATGIGGQELLLLCLSRRTGEELWRREVDRGNEFRMKHNSSSPSPVTDGTHVWVMSGNGRVVCFDFDGRQRWQLDVPAKYGRFGHNHGYGSSPLLLDGKLIIPVLHGMRTDEPSYVLALNAATGAELWRVERPTDAISESPDAYTTPAVVEVDGRKQIVVLGGDYITGHDAETGAELWRSGGLNPRNSRSYRIVPSPTVRDGMIFAPTRQTPLLALRVGGRGDITETHRAWSWTGRHGPDVPTPISDGERFYMVDDGGMITCLDARTGTVVYGPHDTGIGRVSSSPILADGKIHVIGESAETAVIQAGPTYQLLANNRLDGSYTLSTPAFADGEIFIRTGTHLYCIAQPTQQ